MTWTPEDMDGLFAGQFEPHEYEGYIESGTLRFSYEGVAGFMGMARLRLCRNVEVQNA